MSTRKIKKYSVGINITPPVTAIASQHMLENLR